MWIRENYIDQLLWKKLLISAWCPVLSYESALLAITDDILMTADKESLTCLVLLDYFNLFGHINNKLPLGVLHSIRFQESVINLMRTYLTNRKQLVTYKNMSPYELLCVCVVECHKAQYWVQYCIYVKHHFLVILWKLWII